MPSYLQTDSQKRKQEIIRSAVEYFQELIRQHNSKEKAKQKVFQRTGVVL